MANNKAYISLGELKSIAKSLETERQQINSTYKSKIIPVLESSKKCFFVAGLDTQEIIENFNSIFNDTDTRLTNLINVLNNNVIAEYSEIAQAITKMFNSDFASKLRSLLNLKNSIYVKNIKVNSSK